MLNMALRRSCFGRKLLRQGIPFLIRRGWRGLEKSSISCSLQGRGILIFLSSPEAAPPYFPCLQERITLAEKQALTQQLLECGASIEEINAITKTTSPCPRGGQLARAAFPAITVEPDAFPMWWVDKMDVIASGPFVPDQSTFKQAWGDHREIRAHGTSLNPLEPISGKAWRAGYRKHPRLGTSYSPAFATANRWEQSPRS